MNTFAKWVDERRAVAHLMDLLAVEGLSGHERAVAELVRKKLIAAGCKASWIKYDQAHRRNPRAAGFEVGNLIVRLPGTTPGVRRMFLGHLDTVPLCRGAVPARRGHRIVPKGRTALGADNRTAVACLVTLAETLLKHRLPHPPLTLLFTVGEEIGMVGASAARPSDLGRPAVAFNMDSGEPARFVRGAIGAVRWEVALRGISSHAGLHPEDGVSAIVIAAKALADLAANGWTGKIVKGRREGRSNTGHIRGGEATNQVADACLVRGECRSHDLRFLDEIVKAHRRAFVRAAASVRNARGQAGRADFRVEGDYRPFVLKEDHPLVQFAFEAARAAGLKPTTDISNGGLDANPLNENGIPTLTFGAGMHGAHSLSEYADVKEYLGGCRLAVVLATRALA